MEIFKKTYNSVGTYLKTKVKNYLELKLFLHIRITLLFIIL